MFNYVHIDEKWFYLSKKSESKNFITKVMFMIVVARPRFDANGVDGIENRTTGAIKTKSILFVTKYITRACLIEKVLPSMRSKWSASTPYVGVNDLKFMEASQRDGFDMKLCFQPPDSLDLNVLDLGFLEQFMEVVEISFNEMKVERFYHIFLTLQCCMNEVMKVSGGNNYKVPHMNKETLERERDLLLQVRCDVGTVNQALALLQQ
ncbi:hypothetical protein R3W88_007999 [Solanum pinnatisectum]|uniref:Uncharacterized protein n=1 Tax=Solanum pinnatisectum TaxID=50273 RepID=A0AAV9M7E5_9SOLN|nr:hypothetical protein R3W88_007999 [Solanum pinnatisectum]